MQTVNIYTVSWQCNTQHLLFFLNQNKGGDIWQTVTQKCCFLSLLKINKGALCKNIAPYTFLESANFVARGTYACISYLRRMLWGSMSPFLFALPLDCLLSMCSAFPLLPVACYVCWRTWGAEWSRRESFHVRMETLDGPLLLLFVYLAPRVFSLI